MPTLRLVVALPFLLAPWLAAATTGSTILWYDQPAPTGTPDGGSDGKRTWPIFEQPNPKNWAGGSPYMTEALPVGNGRVGAMVFGGTALERLMVNEISLWTGDENPSGVYETMGAYQPLGNLWLTQPGHEGAGEYRRDLDLKEAMARVSYRANGVRYTRELIASAPAHVLAWRLTADQPGKLTGNLTWQSATPVESSIQDRRIMATGQLPNGLRFATGLEIAPEGGTVESGDQGLSFRNCDSLVVYITAATDYAMDVSKGYRSGNDPALSVRNTLKAAVGEGWDKVRAAQARDHQAFFNRVRLDLGSANGAQNTIPTDKRRRQPAQADPEMEALLFNYGRYLLISCSRPGSLPANLQGMWNDVRVAPWYSDYHTNINVQMNYWPAEATHLPEIHTPLLDLVLSQIEPWRKATALSPDFKPVAPNTPNAGWAVRTSHNIFGGGGWKWDKTANVWYAHHFWEHYAFNQDKEWLRRVGWPVMRDLAEFWLARLKALPDGTLVVPDGWSPEQGPTEDGVSYSQQKIWNHFTNCLDALAILGGEEDLRQRLADARGRLLPPAVGTWGQLLEWSTEKARPVFSVDARWEKSAEPLVTRFIEDARKNPASAQGLVWERLGKDRTGRLTANPRDFASLTDGLNALVTGPALITEPAFVPIATPSLLELQNRADKIPGMQSWLNWSLLTRALGLGGLVSTEDTPLNTHRHTSHLFAVYPGRQISPEQTPVLAEAARISLIGRSDSGNVNEWAFAWRTNLYARLRDGDSARRQIAGFMRSTCPNLFGYHPPMQIDGNFGITAGISEMLLQSHAGVIDFLPALPKGWPTGSVAGLRARGGVTVDLEWKDGQLTKARLLCPRGGRFKVRSGRVTAEVVLEPDKQFDWVPSGN
ncbi:MAG: glycoside hydrolase N-terminal domain-containing protein [Candidatus Methylacidiphilales bacterium]|nr:glycoside hydrolase N-terminal domain-containing protein [Candidatus Methylacidiphilales bacterium]